MTIQELFESGALDDEYADYIMENSCASERIICNGDTLIEAMEDGYLMESFLDSMENKNASN
jgi:hypothetical protein